MTISPNTKEPTHHHQYFQGERDGIYGLFCECGKPWAGNDTPEDVLKQERDNAEILAKMKWLYKQNRRVYECR